MSGRGQRPVEDDVEPVASRLSRVVARRLMARTLRESTSAREGSPSSRKSSRRPRKPTTDEESLRPTRSSAGSTATSGRVGRGPGAEPLRVAYLELLKLCLCDLAGARTLSVSRTGDTRRPDSPVYPGS